MLSDAHCHFDETDSLAKIQQENQMLALINCDSPAEWERNQRFIGSYKNQVLSFGIHPWHAAAYTYEEVRDYLEKAEIIGEIGLDTLWTETPIDKQRKIFIQQLRYAYEKSKPVVLHTKACEEEILSSIQSYPNKYLIHWYSSMEYQKEYIACGCYFTIGIDLTSNPAVQKLALQVPLDRLLIETDGIGAIEWVKGKRIATTEYPKILKEHVHQLAQLRNVSDGVLEEILYENLQNYLKK